MSEPHDPAPDDPPLDDQPVDEQPVGDQPPADEPSEDESERPDRSPVPRSAESEWQHRRRLAAVFGEVLPETTRDERDPGEDGGSEEWLRRQVPPHHG